MSWRDRPTFVVARREVREGLRSRAMRITLLITVIAVVALIVLADVFGSSSSRPTVDVAVGPHQRDGRAVATPNLVALGDALTVNIHATSAGSDDEARQLVVDEAADIAIVGGGSEILTRQPIGAETTGKVADVARTLQAQIGLDTALLDAGLSADQVAAAFDTSGPQLRSVEAPGADDSGRSASAGVGNVALFLMLQIYGGWVLTAVTSEKSNRVVEVLLSVVKPIHLLLGKLIGTGTVALVHAGVLVAAALIASRFAGADVAKALPASGLLGAIVWFLAGYALYSAAYAAAGSLVSRTEDAQGIAFPIGLPLLVGYIASFSVLGGTNPVLWILAFFPPTAVLAMPALYQAGYASAAVMLASLAVTIVTIALVVRLAAAIYERSILRTGKPVKWREAFRRDEPRPASTAP